MTPCECFNGGRRIRPIWSESSTTCAGAGATSWCCAARSAVLGLGASRWCSRPGASSRCGSARHRSSCSGSCWRSALVGARRLVRRPAAAAARVRRAGRALSRGARAVAGGGDHQRGRSQPARRGEQLAAFARARAAARARRRSRRCERSKAAAASSARRCAATRRARASIAMAALALFLLGPPTCATPCRRCSSSRAASRPRRRTASR